MMRWGYVNTDFAFARSFVRATRAYVCVACLACERQRMSLSALSDAGSSVHTAFRLLPHPRTTVRPEKQWFASTRDPLSSPFTISLILTHRKEEEERRIQAVCYT